MRTFILFLMTSLSTMFLCQNVNANDQMSYGYVESVVGNQLKQDFNIDTFKLMTSCSGNQSKHDMLSNDHSFKNQAILDDLTGEIVVTEGGMMTEAYTYTIIEMYEYIDICYTGPENVEYTIKLNGDVLNGSAAEWVDSIRGYRVSFVYFLQHGAGYSFSGDIEIVVSAEGYNDLSTTYYAFYSLVPSPPTINGSYLTPDALIVSITYHYSIYGCNLPETNENTEYYSPYHSYKAERLDHDYYVTVFASNRSPMSTVSGFVKETLFVPARLYGDVDGDECLMIHDVSVLIDYLLGNSYYEIYETNADINHDEQITIADVTMLIDKLLDIR